MRVLKNIFSLFQDNREILDLSAFGNEIAFKTSWEPLVGGGTNFCTHRAQKNTSLVGDVFVFKTAIQAYLFAISFVALGAMNNSSFGCCDREAALQRVGLETLANRRLDALSGGQQQRALLARTLVQPSRVLLLDEPCASIDPPSREQLIALMRQLADAGQTLLVSNHDWGSALDFYDRVIVLDGRVLADGPPQQVRCMLGSTIALQESCHD